MKNLHLDHENRPRKYRVTPADMEALRQRHFEAGEKRQIEADLNLLRAIALGQSMKRGGD